MNKLKGKFWAIAGLVLFTAAVIVCECVDMMTFGDVVIYVVMAMPILAYSRSNYNWLGAYLSWLAFVIVIRIPVCGWYATHSALGQLPIQIDVYLYRMVTGMVNLSGMLLWVAFVSVLSMANAGRFIKKQDKGWSPNCRPIRQYSNFVSTTVFAYAVICACSVFLYWMKPFVTNVIILALVGFVLYIAYGLSRRVCIKEFYKRISDTAKE